MIRFSKLGRGQIGNLRDLDRSEEVFHIYYHRNGSLVLEEEYYDIPEWTDSRKSESIQFIKELYERGGSVYGTWNGDLLVGMITLDSQFLGKNNDLLNLNGLWVSKSYRKRGVASKLVDMVIEDAKSRGAKGLYVSATPSKNTVEFYQKRGFALTEEVDEKLFELEPEDIHMVLKF